MNKERRPADLPSGLNLLKNGRERREPNDADLARIPGLGAEWAISKDQTWVGSKGSEKK